MAVTKGTCSKLPTGVEGNDITSSSPSGGVITSQPRSTTTRSSSTAHSERSHHVKWHGSESELCIVDSARSCATSALDSQRITRERNWQDFSGPCKQKSAVTMISQLNYQVVATTRWTTKPAPSYYRSMCARRTFRYLQLVAKEQASRILTVDDIVRIYPVNGIDFPPSELENSLEIDVLAHVYDSCNSSPRWYRKRGKFRNKEPYEERSGGEIERQKMRRSLESELLEMEGSKSEVRGEFGSPVHLGGEALPHSHHHDNATAVSTTAPNCCYQVSPIKNRHQNAAGNERFRCCIARRGRALFKKRLFSSKVQGATHPLFISQPPGRKRRASRHGARAIHLVLQQTAVILIPDYAGGVAKRKSALVVCCSGKAPSDLLWKIWLRCATGKTSEAALLRDDALKFAPIHCSFFFTWCCS